MLDKIDKYIRRYTKDYNESINSNYYNLPIGTIRVSNHMAKDSSALFSIIITKNDTYILCIHSNLNKVRLFEKCTILIISFLKIAV